MARIRYIKPEFFEDARIGALSMQARLLFIGLWTLMDRNGLAEATPLMLRSRVFAFDDVKLKDVERWLGELIASGRIRKVVIRGQDLLFCPTLRRHQHFHYKERSKYLLSEEETKALDEPRASPGFEQGQPYADPPGNGKGVTGTGREIREACKHDFDFDSVYQKYPRKVGKTEGLRKAKTQIRSQGDFNSWSQSVDRFVAHHRKAGTDPKFIPHFSTFMNSWRDWLDPDAGSTKMAPAGAGETTAEYLARKAREAEEDARWRRQEIEHPHEDHDEPQTAEEIGALIDSELAARQA